MTHVRDDSQLHCLLVEAFGGCRASDASAVLLARMRGDSLRTLGQAAGVELPNACGESRHELSVQFGASFLLAVAAPCSRLRIVQTLGFGALERLFLDQQSLTLVLLPRAAPFQYHGGERGVLPRPPCERRIAGRQEREVVQVRTGETESASLAGKKDHGVPAEILATVAAARFPVGNEDSHFTRGAIDGGAFGGHGFIPGPDP